MLRRDFDDKLANPRAKKFSRPYVYCKIEKVLLDPSDTYPPLPAVMDKSCIPPGLAVTVPQILTYLAGIVDLELVDVHTALEKRLEKYLLEELCYILCDTLERYLLWI